MKDFLTPTGWEIIFIIFATCIIFIVRTQDDIGLEWKVLKFRYILYIDDPDSIFCRPTLIGKGIILLYRTIIEIPFRIFLDIHFLLCLLIGLILIVGGWYIYFYYLIILRIFTKDVNFNNLPVLEYDYIENEKAKNASTKCPTR